MKASPPKKQKIKILIDDQFCKGCSLCLHVCPKNIFSEGEGRSRGGYRMPRVDGEKECTGCLLCEMTCPDLALTVRREEP